MTTVKILHLNSIMSMNLLATFSRSFTLFLFTFKFYGFHLNSHVDLRLKCFKNYFIKCNIKNDVCS